MLSPPMPILLILIVTTILTSGLEWTLFVVPNRDFLDNDCGVVGGN